MRRYAATVITVLLLMMGLGTSRGYAQSDDVTWLACPFVLDAGVKAILVGLRAKLNPEEFAGLGDLVCQAVELYQDSQRRQQEQTPLSRENAHKFFCVDPLYSPYCDKKPPTFDEALRGERDGFTIGWAIQCLRSSANIPSCARAILNQVNRDAANR